MIKARNIIKTYGTGATAQTILRGVSLEVKEGEFLAIMGRSGAGKSTLMYQLSLLDHPTHGAIIINEIEVTELSSDARTKFRLNNLGYVFQDYALLPELTAVENVALPLLMQGILPTLAFAKASKALDQMKLEDRAGNLPSQLSGGEQQRVSIARAIANDPKILFADEPTANLDRETANTVIQIFEELHKKGQTIVMVTHEEEYGERAERIIFLDDGQIIREKCL